MKKLILICLSILTFTNCVLNAQENAVFGGLSFIGFFTSNPYAGLGIDLAYEREMNDKVVIGGALNIGAGNSLLIGGTLYAKYYGLDLRDGFYGGAYLHGASVSEGTWFAIGPRIGYEGTISDRIVWDAYANVGLGLRRNLSPLDNSTGISLAFHAQPGFKVGYLF